VALVKALVVFAVPLALVTSPNTREHSRGLRHEFRLACTAEQAAISRITLQFIEQGASTVSMGAYQGFFFQKDTVGELVMK
jgi:hypothetical protein